MHVTDVPKNSRVVGKRARHFYEKIEDLLNTLLSLSAVFQDPLCFVIGISATKSLVGVSEQVRVKKALIIYFRRLLSYTLIQATLSIRHFAIF